MSIKDDLDEIEMELKGERMLYRCEQYDTCDLDPYCEDRIPHEYDHTCEPCPKHRCVPVEPERVTGWCGREQGPCYLPGSNPDPQKWCFDGARDCYCRWFHDPSWAQRAGMLEQKGYPEDDWIVLGLRSTGEVYVSQDRCTHEYATRWTRFFADRPGFALRMFRWSSGERG